MTAFVLVPGANQGEPVVLVGHSYGGTGLAAEPEWRAKSPVDEVTGRFRGQPGWEVSELDATHNVLRNGPDAVVEILLRVA
jgi:hypothetical protein